MNHSITTYMMYLILIREINCYLLLFDRNIRFCHILPIAFRFLLEVPTWIPTASPQCLLRLHGEPGSCHCPMRGEAGEGAGAAVRIRPRVSWTRPAVDGCLVDGHEWHDCMRKKRVVDPPAAPAPTWKAPASRNPVAGRSRSVYPEGHCQYAGLGQMYYVPPTSSLRQ